MTYTPQPESRSSHMQWGLLAPATVILGGAGAVFLGGAQEAAQNGANGWVVVLALSAALGIWGLLAFLYVLNWRAAGVRAAMAVNPFIRPRKGGFLKGAIIGTLFVVVLQIASVLIGLFYPGLEQGERNFFFSVPTFYLTALYTVFPIAPVLGGIVGKLWRSTSI
ncbi:ABC transporter permease [Stenotrophomonas acidaminiphila]|uniref:ABC transporter permease n=1 Tax=Stenotrophomonas acidaminiphila TaxID=128780 RepID=UPI003BF22EE4